MEKTKNDDNRKMKGRVVYQGNDVKTEKWEDAMWKELSSSPATMAGSKSADLFGNLPGNTIEQADATQAYTQAPLGEDCPDTWVRLPYEYWPKWWKDEGYKDPVCPLVLSLYGHPQSGAYWERHCHAHLVAQGFEPINDWRSCYVHKALKLYLVLYVDDFKLAGPAAKDQHGLSNVDKGWQLITTGNKQAGTAGIEQV